MSARLAPVLVGFVIEGRSVTQLAVTVAEVGHRRTAEAIVVERLREALHRLVDYWGLAGGPRGTSATARRDAVNGSKSSKPVPG